MTYVPIVPVVTPPPPPSRQTQELADLLGRVIQEYEKGHPTVTGPEVREALQLARRASTKDGGQKANAVIVALAGGIALMAGLIFLFLRQDGGGEGTQSYIMVAIVGAGIVAGLVALLKRNR